MLTAKAASQRTTMLRMGECKNRILRIMNLGKDMAAYVRYRGIL